MSRYVRAKLVATRDGWTFNDRWFATPIKWNDKLGCASCAFLRGTPGHRVSCSIYETRPDVCRSFKPGGKACKEARRELSDRLNIDT